MKTMWPVGNIRVVFPLTPALSLGEREKLFQRWNKSVSAGISTRYNTVFPLPKGEGQGEGERSAIRSAARTLHDFYKAKTLFSDDPPSPAAAGFGAAREEGA
jgi:hypothetical protein